MIDELVLTNLLFAQCDMIKVFRLLEGYFGDIARALPTSIA